jgi:hypothetical protein
MRLSLSITNYWWPDGPAGLGVRLAGMVSAADAVPAVREIRPSSATTRKRASIMRAIVPLALGRASLERSGA